MKLPGTNVNCNQNKKKLKIQFSLKLVKVHHKLSFLKTVS